MSKKRSPGMQAFVEEFLSEDFEHVMANNHKTKERSMCSGRRTMDVETLRRQGQEILFEKDLEAFLTAVVNIGRAAKNGGDLGDPSVVVDCLMQLSQEIRGLYAKWYELMMDELSDDDLSWKDACAKAAKAFSSGVSDDDHPDPEPSEDGRNVGLDALTKRELHDILDRSELSKIELLVRKELA